MTSPLHDLPAEIPFDAIHAEDVEPAILALVERAKADVAAVGASTAPATYENVLGALEGATVRLSRAMGVVSHLESVRTTPALRAAVVAVKPVVAAFHTSIPLDPALWARVRALAESPAGRALTGEQRRHLDNTVADFRRNGAELPPEGKARLSEVDVALTNATTRFSQNVLDATTAFSIVIEDEARLSGLPDAAKAVARAAAERKGQSGWRFGLDGPSVMSILTHANDASLRETIWRAYNTRASAGDVDNRPLLAEILALRHERARLLGKNDFSDLVLDDRMAKNGAKAASFVEDLRVRSDAGFRRDAEDLSRFRKELEGEGAPALAPWDVGYYAEKLRIARFDLDEEALRPYFEVGRVLDGLRALARRLYGLHIEPRPGTPVWHPDVVAYSARREGDAAERAIFYVDLFPRDDKRGGAWMNGLRVGTKRADGSRDPHVALFAANVTPRDPAGRSLLSHDEVTTLFHEFGHLLHHLLTEVETPSLAGTNVAWDFVELPSQIHENWAWEREALDLFAKHHETNETIPEPLYAAARRARTFRGATDQMRQLGFADLDLRLHRVYDPRKDGDLLAYARTVAQQYAATPLPDPYAMVCGFTHLFAHPVGYGAGYYSYKWAEVLDADAFSFFVKNGIFDPATGEKFRRTILSRGDAADPMELFVAFAGREPKLDALLERTGITS